MQSAADTSVLYTQAWIGVAIVAAYYVSLFLLFRLKAHHQVEVTEYEPPKGVTPAMAAYLAENGRSERAFAAALVSLCAKGFLTIEEDGDWCTVRKRREDDTNLPAEESLILRSLGAESGRAYTFNAAEDSRLCTTYIEFKDALESIAKAELISAHWTCWLAGIGCSWVAIALVAEPMATNNASWASVAFVGVWILLGGSCLVAALRVWPLTLRKLISYIPWDKKPSRPLDLNDAIPLFLTGSAFMGFVLLAVLTSTNFALLVTGLLVINVFGLRACTAPTRDGRKALAELRNFREFLARTDSDLMNRENLPGQTPTRFEKFSAYAVALDVERGWGESFAENLVELLQFDQAYRRRLGPVEPGEGRVELKIGRK